MGIADIVEAAQERHEADYREREASSSVRYTDMSSYQLKKAELALMREQNTMLAAIFVQLSRINAVESEDE